MKPLGPARATARRSVTILAAIAVTSLIAASCGSGSKSSSEQTSTSTTPSTTPSTVVSPPTASSSASQASAQGIHKIKHIVVIMQENRSFDSYFGTYLGADGIPNKNGEFSVCIPDP